MSEILSVSFGERKKAHSLGAKFIRGSIFTGVGNAWVAEETDTEAIALYGQSEVSERLNRKKEWDDILRTHDTIKLSDAIRTLGLPPEEIQRVAMLKVFSNPGTGLKITWDALCAFSEEFKDKYGAVVVEDLAYKYLRGFCDLYLAIDNSNATEEEKELLRFVFPID